MLRMIIVASRERPELFSVLLDRRFLPPGAKPGATSDPGQRERRDIYDELQQRGFVMIRLW